MGKSKKKIPELQLNGDSSGSVINSTSLDDEKKYCCISFKLFKSECITINSFNNHYKNREHYESVISSFIGQVLPKISQLTTKELMSGGNWKTQFHFHPIQSEKFNQIRMVLKKYSFSDEKIENFLMGQNIFQFCGNLQGQWESRIICEHIDGVLYLLFFDTNHHIYLNKTKTRESLSFDYCPYKEENQCLQSYHCIAREYLDWDKIQETFGYNYAPYLENTDKE